MLSPKCQSLILFLVNQNRMGWSGSMQASGSCDFSAPTQSMSISLLWQPFLSGEGSWQWLGWPRRACLSFFTSIHCKSYHGLDTNFQKDSPFKSSAQRINSVLFFYKIVSRSIYLRTERELTVILLPLQRPESPPHNFGRTSMTLRNPVPLRDGTRWPPAHHPWKT